MHRFSMEKRCKSRYKKSAPKERRKNSADSAIIPLNLRKYSAQTAEIPRYLFILARQKSSGERLNFDWKRLKTIALCASDANWFRLMQPICCNRYKARQYSILVVDNESSASSLSRMLASVNRADIQKKEGGIVERFFSTASSCLGSATGWG